ncbi:MAG: hypothetical protein Q8941_05230 [Bacteroidota bacterium]|nr:hypothetical protein [Bacteroidota bacterium]
MVKLSFDDLPLADTIIVAAIARPIKVWRRYIEEGANPGNPGILLAHDVPNREDSFIRTGQFRNRVNPVYII